VREFDLFLPLFFNDGEPIPKELFQTLQSRLLEQFDGLTFFPQPNKGVWRMGDITYHDEIVILRTITRKPKKARQYLADLKVWLKQAFRQEEILIVERRIKLVD
jgi:hypothetical protein